MGEYFEFVVGWNDVFRVEYFEEVVVVFFVCVVGDVEIFYYFDVFYFEFCFQDVVLGFVEGVWYCFSGENDCILFFYVVEFIVGYFG